MLAGVVTATLAAPAQVSLAGEAGEAEMNGLTLRPYAAIAYKIEFDDDPVAVTAGSNALAGRFTAAGFMPPRQWLSADVGVRASLGGQASAVLGYSGRFGDDARGDHLRSVGLHVAFRSARHAHGQAAVGHDAVQAHARLGPRCCAARLPVELP